MDYWATEETNQELMKHLGCDTMLAVFKKLHIDRPARVCVFFADSAYLS